jgi:hypothetical protein
MAEVKHHRRLEQMYRSSSDDTPAGRVSVVFGRARLDAQLEASATPDSVATQLTHQKLLSDAAALAAGSLEKEETVKADNFSSDVQMPDYSGPVVATARVVVAQPPKIVVESVLLTPDGDVVATGRGAFEPSGEPLPEQPAGDAPSADASAADAPASDAIEDPITGSSDLEPAAFMPIFTTETGVLCLN